MARPKPRLLVRRHAARCIGRFPPRERRRGCDGLGLALFPKDRHADDADVLGTPGAGGVGVRERREVEGRGLAEAFPPSEDVIGASGPQDIAGLPRIGGFATNDVHPIHGHYGTSSPSRLAILIWYSLPGLPAT